MHFGAYHHVKFLQLIVKESKSYSNPEGRQRLEVFFSLVTSTNSKTLDNRGVALQFIHDPW